LAADHSGKFNFIFGFQVAALGKSRSSQVEELFPPSRVKFDTLREIFKHQNFLSIAGEVNFIDLVDSSQSTPSWGGSQK
jgi:hypothetical protein